jgi:RNA polymerase sigma-70 factor (ECF subfamily)
MTNLPADIDYALVRRVARGQPDALAELIRRHQQRLYHLAFRLLKDQMEAEDALQEVFVKVYEHAARFRLRQKHPADSLDQDGAPAISHSGPTPLEALEEQDLAQRLEALLEALPENQRRAMILKRFGGLSYQEIGEELGLSPQAVDGLLKRARKTLKDALKGYLE